MQILKPFEHISWFFDAIMLSLDLTKLLSRVEFNLLIFARCQNTNHIILIKTSNLFSSNNAFNLRIDKTTLLTKR